MPSVNDVLTKTFHILWGTAILSIAAGCGTTQRELPPLDASPGNTWTRPTDGMEMALIPAGQFAMGSSPQELEYALELCTTYYDDCELGWFEDETPQHTVRVDGFWMDRTEVTNAQFAVFLNSMSNRREGGMYWLDEAHSQIGQINGKYQPISGYDDYPVVEVTWYGASAYCRWVRGRLPTEAEWEYAARGQSQAPFPWRDQIDGDKLNFCDANCELEWADRSIDDGYPGTAPVGSYPQGESWSGVMDLAGNVYEWVNDWYADDYYAGSPPDDPSGPSTGENRVLRGARGTSALSVHEAPIGWK